MPNIFLIGLRGSGKTTVGQLLAQHLRRDFFDTDQQIAADQKCTVAEIFKVRGEAEFRRLESAALAELCREHATAVIATGGGIVLNPANRDWMRTHGLVFHLNASPEVLYRRIQQDPASDTLRPSLTGLTGVEDMRATADRRARLYEAARHREIAVDNQTPEAVLAAIVAALPKPIQP